MNDQELTLTTIGDLELMRRKLLLVIQEQDKLIQELQSKVDNDNEPEDN